MSSSSQPTNTPRTPNVNYQSADLGIYNQGLMELILKNDKLCLDLMLNTRILINEYIKQQTKGLQLLTKLNVLKNNKN